MNILEANINILREITYSLKIVNGESAKVFLGGPTYFFPNGTLNLNGYWEDFLNTTDSITMPIISIDSMYRTQSLFYRNESQMDELNITVDHDYNNNILEFLNRGIKDFDLDYSSIDELIFILEASIINSVGYSQKETIFVGRPEVNVNSTDKLSFKVHNLDYIVKDSTFENNVIRTNSGSCHNFISLKKSFEYIYNMPHGINDDYAYPVCPFDIDEDIYIKSADEGIIESEQLLGTDEVYAEANVKGNDSKLNVFFYRASAECGFLTKELNSDGTVINSYTTYMNTLKFFTNEEDIKDISKDTKKGLQRYNVYSNVFRMFRPIKVFVAPEDKLDMKVGSANISSLKPIIKTDAPTDQYKIRENDEILVLEQLMETQLDDAVGGLKFLLHNSTSNIYYYNLTQNIMYWNPIANFVSTIPLPKQWLYISSYSDMDEWSAIPVEYDITTPHPAIQLINAQEWFLTGNLCMTTYYNGNTQRDIHYGLLSFTDKQNTIKVKPNSMPAYKYDDFTLEYEARDISDDDDRAVMEYMLDIICSVKPKSVKIKNGNIYWTTQKIEGTGAPYGAIYENTIISKNVFSDNSSFIKTTGTELENNFKTGFVGEIDTTFSTHSCIVVYDFGDNNDMFAPNMIFFNGLYFQTYTDNTYKAINLDEYDGANYFPYYNVIKKTSGSYLYNWYTKPTNYRILDVNMNNDRMIYLDTDTSKVNYARISDDEILFEDVTEQPDMDYLLSMYREKLYFTNTNTNSLYVSYSDIDSDSLRLLSYTGDRYSAAFGLANSYFKNMYSNNLGIKKIGFDQPNSITLTDSMIKSIDITPYTYNNLEYQYYDVEKNNGVSLDNDVAVNQEDDDTVYDEAKDVYFYSNKDVNFSSFSLTRNSTDLTWVFVNEFGTETGVIDPITYNTFEIPLSGLFYGITIYFNFFDTLLEVGETFRGSITRRNLILNSSTKTLSGSEKKYVWKDDKNLTFKFPFLNNKNVDAFSEVLENYWLEDDVIRKLFKVEVVIDELILFNNNYNIFNLGEQRIIIDSKEKYLDGYGLFNGSLRKFEDNRASFYIEKATYNFNVGTTKFTLISI